MNLTEVHQSMLAPLFAVVPFDAAMPSLLPDHPAPAEAVAAARALMTTDALRENRSAQSALWLYVDELDRSHALSQDLHHATGSYLHGIMHRREGDFWNSHYWIRQTGYHPVWQQIPGYNPDDFIDAVAGARGHDLPELVALQRREWSALMTYCLTHPQG